MLYFAMSLYVLMLIGCAYGGFRIYRDYPKYPNSKAIGIMLMILSTILAASVVHVLTLK